MIDRDCHRLLGLFGDAREHHMLEIIKFGSILLKKSERDVEKFFKRRLLANSWVYRVGNAYDPRLDHYKLTAKGDELFRLVQIQRIQRSGNANDKTLEHFRKFDRTVHGKHGAHNLGDFLTELKMNGN